MDMHQPIQVNVHYQDAIIERLRDHYLAKTPLPDVDGAPLTLARFYHLYRAVIAEGYGHAAHGAQSTPSADQPVDPT